MNVNNSSWKIKFSSSSSGPLSVYNTMQSSAPYLPAFMFSLLNECIGLQGLRTREAFRDLSFVFANLRT